MTGPPQPDQMEGLVLAGRYRLDSWIATGGMAEVWAGVDEVLDRPVAVKVMHRHLARDDVFLHRFRREAIAAAQLNHRGIVAVHDAVEDAGLLAIVMELVTGPTLKERMWSPELPLTIDESVEIVAAVAHALDYAHRAELVHRDVKPANILLADDGRVLLTDFGIAKASTASDLTEGDVIGSVKYIAPERLDHTNEVDDRSDVYSLGVVLYELLCGEAPFVSDDERSMALARLHRLPARPAVLRPDVPHDLDEITMKALATDPADRWETAADMAAALSARYRRTEPIPLPDDSYAGNFIEEELEETGTEASDHGADIRARLDITALQRQAEVFVVAAILLGAVILALVLLNGGGSDDGDSDADPSETTVSVPVTSAADSQGTPIAQVFTFDPLGTGPPGERDGEVALSVDGDAATGWRTEGYNSRRFGGLKGGVGLIVQLPQATAVSTIAVSSPSSAWSGEVYVANERSVGLAGWGSVAGRFEQVPAGTSVVTVNGSTGSWVLLWFTDLGDGATPVRLQVNEVIVNP